MGRLPGQPGVLPPLSGLHVLREQWLGRSRRAALACRAARGCGCSEQWAYYIRCTWKARKGRVRLCCHAVSLLRLLCQPGGNKRVCSSHGCSPFLPASYLAPRLPWVQWCQEQGRPIGGTDSTFSHPLKNTQAMHDSSFVLILINCKGNSKLHTNIRFY